jgi:hypothetical protein
MRVHLSRFTANKAAMINEHSSKIANLANHNVVEGSIGFAGHASR